MNDFWDRLGISASVICIVHCLFTPALVLLVPLVGQFLSEAWFHIVIAIVIFPVAIFALWRGYRIHRLARTMALGFAGLACIIWGMSHSFHAGRPHSNEEVLLMILGGSFLSLAHFYNLRACRLHTHSATTHSHD